MGLPKDEHTSQPAGSIPTRPLTTKDATTHFIEAAARTLSDNAELRSSAISLLENIVTSQGNACNDAVERWDEADRRKNGNLWKTLLYTILSLVSAILLTISANVFFHYENMFSMSNFFHNSQRITEQDVAGKLTHEQGLLLFGDISRHSTERRMKALWDSDPRNPAYFAEYANAYLSEFKKLPPDFLSTARRIDPNNAWFTYVAAGFRAKDAVKIRTRSKSAKAAKAPPEWDILDATAFNDSISLLRQARTQPECDSRFHSLRRDQMKLLRNGTPSEVVFSLAYCFAKPDDSEYQLGNLGPVIAAKAWLCGTENDRETFKELLLDADNFFTKRMESDVELTVGELITTNAAFGFVSNASPVASQFGLYEESARLDEALKIVNRRKALRESKVENPNSRMRDKYGGGLATLTTYASFKILENPPLLTQRELEAGRLMDHETFDWILSFIAWAMLVVTMGLSALFQFRSPMLIRRLTGRLEMLVPPGDWLAVLGLGVVLPMLFFTWIHRFSPLGGHGLSMEYDNIYTPYIGSVSLGLAQWVALVLLVISSSAAACCYCLWKRLRPLALVKASSATSIIPIVCLAAFIPVSGWSVVHYSDSAGVASFVLAGIATCWFAMILVKALFGQYQIQLRYGVVARMLLPCCAFAALLPLSAAPYFKEMAFYWSGRDTLVRMDPDHPSGSNFQYRTAVQLRKELRETLSYGSNALEK